MECEKCSILLICTSQIDLGLKSVAGSLVAAGFSPKVLFLDTVSNSYSNTVLHQLDPLLAEADLIGISVVEISFARSVGLVGYIRTHFPGKKIIMGGIYALLKPESCMEHADAVCIGEGEHAMLQMAKTYASTRLLACEENVWLRTPSGDLLRRPRSAAIQNLDGLPAADHFSPERHYYLSRYGQIEQSAHLIQPARATLDHAYNLYVMLSRGCHLSCSYCSVPVLKQLTQGSSKPLRKRSVASSIAELENVTKMAPRVDFIYIFDNDFLARTRDEIQEFATLYKEKVGKPFFCYGSPRTLSREKVSMLLEAGLEKFVFGIQSGSDRILGEIYSRHEYQRHISKAARELSEAIKEHERKTGKLLIPTFDIIYNNPWETKEDLLSSVGVVLEMKRYFKRFSLFSMPLTIFESTPLYEKAVEDGFIETNASARERKVDISYQQAVENLRRGSKHLYLNAILYLMRYGHSERMAGFLPREFLSQFMLNDAVVSSAEALDQNKLFRALVHSILFVLPTRDRKFFVRERIKQAWPKRFLKPDSDQRSGQSLLSKEPTAERANSPARSVCKNVYATRG